MKIALINDTHFGARAESPAFNEFFFKFWDNVFFPYIEQHGIKKIIHLGDIVDRRKYINYVILNSMRVRFMKRIGELGCTIDVIVGNHDVPYRNTNEINAMSELFADCKFLRVFHKPETINYDGLDIAIIPWINSGNLRETLDFIDNTPAQIAMGHLEVAGFEMDKGSISQTGFDRSTFKKFETAYTGHFHHKSTDGHIYYLGNQFEITWADYGDQRGFHVFDTNTRKIEFVANPYRMFHKIEYDDSNGFGIPHSLTFEAINARDFSEYTSTTVKVIVINKTNPILFDKFMDKLYEAHPLDVDIVEDFIGFNEMSDEDIIDKADSTTTIVDKYIDSIEIGLDKEKLKSLMREIYNQAHDLEAT